MVIMKRIFFLLCTTLSTSVWAWGPVGHKIVAQIAEDDLTPAAHSAIAEILNGASLADVANWADSVKNSAQWQHTKSWHFVDIPDGERYDTIEHAEHGDAITAITDNVATLKNAKASADEREVALKFLVHFVGDLHQPLHAGRPTDTGGNSIKVVFMGKSMNLHSLWDSGMITTQNMDYMQYARYLSAQSFLNPDYDIPELEFSRVIAEDMSYRGQIYDFGRSPSNPVRLDQSYLSKNLATMNARLLNGGKRLAEILNELFPQK